MLRTTVPAGLALILAALPAYAATKTDTLPGTKLVLKLDCPVEVTIDPDPGLSGKVSVEARAEDQDELDGVHFTGGDAVVVEQHGHCAEEGFHFGFSFNFNPFEDVHINETSLKLAVKVPEGLPIELKVVRAGKYEIGDIGGPLKLDLSGASQVKAERLSALEAVSAGASAIEVAHLDGPGSVDLRGGGGVSIKYGKMPSLKLDSRGAGALEVKGGEIGTLDVELAGAGAADIGARVTGDATLRIMGIGAIEVKKVDGTVHKEVDGLGTIEVKD
jgi:hypothetical protein